MDSKVCLLYEISTIDIDDPKSSTFLDRFGINKAKRMKINKTSTCYILKIHCWNQGGWFTDIWVNVELIAKIDKMNAISQFFKVEEFSEIHLKTHDRWNQFNNSVKFKVEEFSEIYYKLQNR